MIAHHDPRRFLTSYRWLVSKRHEIRGGVLVGKGINRSPRPIAETCQQLAFVARGIVDPVDFANAFGLLGHSLIVANPDDRRGGDPLDWFMAHANTVAMIIKLIGIYNSGDRVDRFQIKAPIAYGEKIDRPAEILLLPKASMRLYAYKYLQQLLNPNLEHVHLFFPAEPAPMFLKTRALVDAVYIQLGHYPNYQQTLVRRCEDCGEFFVGADPRQRHCPPPLSSTRSRCASRKNTRNFRRGQEGKGS
jgi:hypothetical protein